MPAPSFRMSCPAPPLLRAPLSPVMAHQTSCLTTPLSPPSPPPVRPPPPPSCPVVSDSLETPIGILLSHNSRLLISALVQTRSWWELGMMTGEYKCTVTASLYLRTMSSTCFIVLQTATWTTCLGEIDVSTSCMCAHMNLNALRELQEAFRG